ncbi:MAG: hypothetical protein R3B57_10440 [Phycisphaerales bacterium]
MLTLWDLLEPRRKKRAARKAPAVAPPVPARPVVVEPAPPRQTPMRDKYEEVTRRMLRVYGVRVRKWRTSMSGVAWQITYADGSVSRLIEAPRPRGPMSAAVFLHEIGHHAIGFNVYKPRCLEEYHAWKFSLETMEREGLNVTDAVRARMRESLDYAVEKAHRRGLKRIPAELAAYLASTPPSRRAG